MAQWGSPPRQGAAQLGGQWEEGSSPDKARPLALGFDMSSTAGTQCEEDYLNKYRARGPWVPTLYATDQGAIRFRNACALVLTSSAHTTEDNEWSGRWKLTDPELAALLRRIENDPAVRQANPGMTSGDGMLAESELLAYIRSERNVEFIKSLPGAIHGILNEEFVKQAIKDYDLDGNKNLDEREWKAFAVQVECMRIQFLMKKSFSAFRTFWGRDQPWERDTDSKDILLEAAGAMLTQGSSSSTQPGFSPVLNGNGMQVQAIIEEAKTKTFQWGRDIDLLPGSYLIPPGWFADLKYYSANIHPLHGIFYCDPNNALSHVERAGMELATIGLTLCTSSLKERWVTHEEAPFEILTYAPVFSVVVVTLPGIAIWWLMFLLFTCPCYFVDKSDAPQDVVVHADRCSCFGGFMGWVFLSGLVFVLIMTMLSTAESDWTGDSLDDVGLQQHIQAVLVKLWNTLHLKTVFLARIQGYMFSWALMLLVYFNPVLAVGNPDPYSKDTLLGNLGIGQWRLEKQRFQISSLMAATGRRYVVVEDELIPGYIPGGPCRPSFWKKNGDDACCRTQ